MHEHVYRKLRELTRPGLPEACVLYAYKGLGAVMVRKPELLVPCRDLFTRALQPTAPAKLKRQALDNLRLLLTADEERQKTLSAPGTTGSAKKVALAEMQSASDHSAAVTGSLQSQLPKILDAMLDPRDAAVRHAALALAGALLSNGIAHPMKILPKIIALEVDAAKEGTADAALGELRQQYERHKEMMTAPAIALSGAREAYQLQLAMRAAAVSGGGPPAAARAAKLTAMYTLHGAQRKPRQAYLRSLLGVLGPEQHEVLPTSQLAPHLKECEWLCHALAEMPYDKEADVLALIHQANRVLSLAADPTISAAAALLGDASYEESPKPLRELEAAARAHGADEAESCRRACHLCAVVGLSFVLKQHLKRAYGLSDVRLQAYDPLEQLKVERQVARLADVPPLDTSAAWFVPAAAMASGTKKARKGGAAAAADADADADVDAAGAAKAPAAATAEGAELAVAQYSWLRALLADDEAGFDFNLIANTPKPLEEGGGKPAAKRRAASKSAKPPPAKSPSGRGSGGRGSGGRGSGGRGGKAAAKKKKKKPDSSDDDDDDDDDDDEFEE